MDSSTNQLPLEHLAPPEYWAFYIRLSRHSLEKKDWPTKSPCKAFTTAGRLDSTGDKIEEIELHTLSLQTALAANPAPPTAPSTDPPTPAHLPPSVYPFPHPLSHIRLSVSSSVDPAAFVFLVVDGHLVWNGNSILAGQSWIDACR